MDDKIVKILERIDRRLASGPPEILERMDERLANMERQLDRFGEFILEVSPSETKADIKNLERKESVKTEPKHPKRKKRVA